MVASSNKPFESHAAEDLMVNDRDGDDDICVISSGGGDAMDARRKRKGSDGSPGEALARLRAAMRKSRGLFRLRRLIKLLKGVEADNGQLGKILIFVPKASRILSDLILEHLFPVEESRSQSDLSVLDAVELSRMAPSTTTTTFGDEMALDVEGDKGAFVKESNSPTLNANPPPPASLPPSPLVRSASGLMAFQQQQSPLQSVSEVGEEGEAGQEGSEDNSTMRNAISSQQSQGNTLIPYVLCLYHILIFNRTLLIP